MADLNVRVKISEIITALETNKQKHLVDLTKATEVYFQDLKKILSDNLKAAKTNDLKHNYFVNLQCPINNCATYDKYIGMFTRAQDEYIEIDINQYQNFFEDQWHWALSAALVNSTYSSKYN